MAKEGVLPTVADMFGGKGNARLDAAMTQNYRTRVESLRDLIELYDRPVTMLEGQIHQQLRDRLPILCNSTQLVSMCQIAVSSVLTSSENPEGCKGRAPVVKAGAIPQPVRATGSPPG